MMQVVWFNRDLRVGDHRPLFESTFRGLVLQSSALHWDFQRAAPHHPAVH